LCRLGQVFAVRRKWRQVPEHDQAVAASKLSVGVVILIVPNSAHLDGPNVGSDIFFDCGGALYPGSRPAEAPGVSACPDINGSMLRWGLLLIIGGAAMSLVAFRRIRRELG